VDDRSGFGTLLGIGLDLSHQVMADLGFNRRSPLDVDVVLVCNQLIKLLLRYQPCFSLSLGQGHPDAPQQLAFMLFTENGSHLLAGITPAERGKVGVMGKALHSDLRLPMTVPSIVILGQLT